MSRYAAQTEDAGDGEAVTDTRHPAKFTDDILTAIVELLPDRDLTILDPFAGVGRVHELRQRGRNLGLNWDTTGIELEKEWAEYHHNTLVGNALNISRALEVQYPYYSAIVTSPCYGNRMADTYAGDGTPRHTYRIYLDRELSEGSSAGLQWGNDYRIFHRRAWAEVTKISKPNAVFVLNIKDHVRDGQVMRVTDFHRRALMALGWRQMKETRVPAPGHRHGANHDARVDYESVIRFDLEVSF